MKIMKKVIYNKHSVCNALLAFVLIASISISGVCAFLIDKSEKTNTFSVGDVSVQLLTNFDLNNNGTFDTGETNRHELSITGPNSLTSGSVFMMQPFIRNTGSADAYVYIEVGMPKANGIPNVSEWFSINNANTGNGNTQWTLVSSDTSDSNFNYYLYAYNTALAGNSSTSFLFNALSAANFVTGAKMSTGKLTYNSPSDDTSLNNVADIANDIPEDYTDKYIGLDEQGYENGWELILKDEDNKVYGIDINAAAGMITEEDFTYDLSIDDIVSFTYDGQEYTSKDLYAYHYSETFPRSLDMSESDPEEEVIFYSVTPPFTVSMAPTIEIQNQTAPADVADIPEADIDNIENHPENVITDNDFCYAVDPDTNIKTYYYKYGSSWQPIDENVLLDPDGIRFTLEDGYQFFPSGDNLYENRENGELGLINYWDDDWVTTHSFNNYVFVSDANGKNIRMLSQYDEDGNLDTSSITSFTFLTKAEYLQSGTNVSVNDNYQKADGDTVVIENGIIKEIYGQPPAEQKEIKFKAYAIQPNAYTASPATSWTQAANSSTNNITPMGNYTYN